MESVLFSGNEKQADLRNGGFLICILFLRVLLLPVFVCSHVMLFALFPLGGESERARRAVPVAALLVKPTCAHCACTASRGCAVSGCSRGRFHDLLNKRLGLDPAGMLADKNDTAFPLKGSSGTWLCPNEEGCCFNPGEDVDGNPVPDCECINKVC